MSETLAQQIAEKLGITEMDANSALDTFADQIGHLADRGGVLAVPGLGRFEEMDGVLSFLPTQELAEAVNHRFSGLDVLHVADDGTTSVAPDEAAIEDVTVQVDDTTDSSQSIPEMFDDGHDDDLVVDQHSESDLDLTDVEPGVPESSSEFVEQQHASDDDTDDTSVEELVSISDSEDSADDAEPTSDSPSISDTASSEEKAKAAIEEITHKESSEKQSPSIAKLFVPLLGILAVVFGLLWLLNRSWNQPESPAVAGTIQTGDDNPITADDPDASDPPSGDVNAGDPSSGNDNGIDGATAAADPIIAQDPTPVWRSGQIDRQTGGYTIVVSSEPTRAEAEVIATSIDSRLDQVVDVLLSEVNGTTRYRVGVGQFSTTSAATRTLNRIADQLPDGSWVVRISPDM